LACGEVETAYPQISRITQTEGRKQTSSSQKATNGKRISAAVEPGATASGSVVELANLLGGLAIRLVSQTRPVLAYR